MLSVKKILCPTDFSKLSDRALVYAADLSARFGAKLYIQHVMEGVFDSVSDLYMAPEDIQAIWASYDHNLDEQLSQRLGSVSPYIKVLSHGSPAQDILQTANEQEIDLIVMGAHGRKGFSRWILGSVTEQVITRGLCPVLVVSPMAYEPRRPVDFRRILVPVGFSDGSLRALEYALGLAEAYRSNLCSLNMAEPMPVSEEAPTPLDSKSYVKRNRGAAPERLSHLAAENVQKQCRVKELVKTSSAHREILRTVKEFDADLIVIGAMVQSSLESELFGLATYQVITGANCPVLTVTGTRDEVSKAA